MKRAWVYMLANRYRGTIYIGVTSSLAHRMVQHRQKEGSKFAAKYGYDRLVYVEMFDRIEEAITREKRLKKWNRAWKIRLIEEQNPQWEDRFEGLV